MNTTTATIENIGEGQVLVTLRKVEADGTESVKTGTYPAIALAVDEGFIDREIGRIQQFGWNQPRKAIAR